MKRTYLILFLFSFTTHNIFISHGWTDQPQYGGILRVLGGEAMVLGYPPEMGPNEIGAAFPAVESLMESTQDRKLAPFLAESVNIDPDNLMITFRLRKNIRFHDGTEFNADAVAYNIQWLGETGKLQYWDNVKSVEIIDAYTVRLHLIAYNNMMIYSLCLVKIFSKQALTTQSVNWLRGHPVGTGPFKLAEWKRGSHYRWEKNSDYWQKGKPYLDAIEIRFINDDMTAAMMMKNKEADVWLRIPADKVLDLEKSGMIKNQWFANMTIFILPNTKDANRPTSKLKVRQAIEYALDKKAIAQALGRGLYKPNKLAAPEGEWGYDPTYSERSYDPAKARLLLKEAGYTTPLKLKLTGMVPDMVTSIKTSMDQAGFDIEIDLADPGRYFSCLFVSGWPDIIVSFAGPDNNFLVTFQRWFGHEPATNLAGFKRSPQLLALSQEAISFTDEADQIAVTKKLVRMLADEADIVPVFAMPASYIVQPYVHCSFMREPVRWRTYDDWMDKH